MLGNLGYLKNIEKQGLHKAIKHLDKIYCKSVKKRLFKKQGILLNN